MQLVALGLVLPAAVLGRSMAQLGAASPLAPAESDGPLKLTKLKKLEPRYSDPIEIERLVNETKAMATHDTVPPDICKFLKQGSTLGTWNRLAYNGPRSNKAIIFNAGSYKTGSTSVDAAARQLGFKSCKIGWGETGADDKGRWMAFQPEGSINFKICPIWDNSNPKCRPDVDVIRNAPNICPMLGDAPWPFAWPTAMRAYPNSKIILTRQKTCADWVYHVKGLWNVGMGTGALTTCWFDAPNPLGWHRRCLETERALVLTAQKLKIKLLVLHATGERSKGNMHKLAKFLGKHVSAHATYPHVSTPSHHYKNEKEPPPNEPDPNADLWGSWNGGVPTGYISPSLPQVSANLTRWLAQL